MKKYKIQSDDLREVLRQIGVVLFTAGVIGGLLKAEAAASAVVVVIAGALCAALGVIHNEE